MFTVELDATRAYLKLEQLPAVAHARLNRSVTADALMLEALVKEKLSGQVLNVKTGDLRRSINNDVTDEPTKVQGRVFSSGDVKYAAIHEFGGVIHSPGGTAYIVTPGGLAEFISNAAAIGLNLPRTAPHDINMPERSFLRSSLRDRAEEIKEHMLKAVREGAREAMA